MKSEQRGIDHFIVSVHFFRILKRPQFALWYSTLSNAFRMMLLFFGFDATYSEIVLSPIKL